jgi:hypothetical protein
MNSMSIPGFTAEVTLQKTGKRHRMVKNYEAPKARQRISPQLKTYCGHAENPCWYSCCTIGDPRGPYGFPDIKCDIHWVCGLQKPDAFPF